MKTVTIIKKEELADRDSFPCSNCDVGFGSQSSRVLTNGDIEITSETCYPCEKVKAWLENKEEKKEKTILG